MSKVANMLNMVNVLKDGKLHSVKDLAEHLEVTSRMVRSYKMELEQSGLYITGVKGIHGGYILDNQANTVDVGLSTDEITILENIDDIVKNNLEEYATLKRVIQKVVNSYKKVKNESEDTKLDTITKECSGLTKKYKELRNAINNKNKVLIKYVSINSGLTKRIVHPAELLTYLGDWYVACFCELRQEIRLFKLEYICEYKVLDETYDLIFTLKT